MRDNYPKISIVTPSYNQGQFLEETILSIINQGYPNLEYIIIDGGSTDNSVDIIKKYENHLTYWVSEKDRGQSNAINKGFKKSNGEIVGWINSDDLLMPGALDLIAEKSKKKPQANVFMGWTIRIDAKSKVLFTNIIPKQHCWLARRGVFYFGQQSWFWKRNMFDYLGFIDENTHACMDIDFLIRQLISKAKITPIKAHLGAFRQHEMTKTSSNNDIWHNDRKRMAKKYKIFNYKHPQKYALILYGLLKVINGNYLKQFLWNKIYKDKHISNVK